MSWKKNPAVYIMSNKRNGTLYVGVTSDLAKRVWEHKNDATKGFTSKYQCHDVVHYECFDDMKMAIEREKQIKSGSRLKKIELIENDNPEWKDLYEMLI